MCVQRPVLKPQMAEKAHIGLESGLTTMCGWYSENQDLEGVDQGTCSVYRTLGRDLVVAGSA